MARSDSGMALKLGAGVQYDLTKCFHEQDCRKVCLVPHVLDTVIKGRAVDTEVAIGSDCTRCGLCAKACPADAIRGAKKTPHVIEQVKCIKCGVCADTDLDGFQLYMNQDTTDSHLRATITVVDTAHQVIGFIQRRRWWRRWSASRA